MKTIHKQKLTFATNQTIKIQENYTILTIDWQHDSLYIWYMIDDCCDIEEIEILIFGTGHEIPNDIDAKYLSTVKMANDNLIWHVFRKI